MASYSAFCTEKLELEQENQALKEKIVELNSDVLSSNEKVSQYKAQFNDFQSTVQEWEERVKKSPSIETIFTYQRSLENLTKENSILSVSLADTRLEVESLTSKVQSLTEKLTRSRTAHKELVEKLNCCQDENLSLLESKAAIEFEMRNLEDALKSKDDCIAVLKSQLVDKTTTCNDLQFKMDTLQNEATSFKLQLKSAFGQKPSDQEVGYNQISSVLSSPISKKTYLELAYLERLPTTMKKQFDYAYTSPRKDSQSYLYCDKNQDQGSVPSSPISYKDNQAFRATDQAGRTSDFNPCRVLGKTPSCFSLARRGDENIDFHTLADKDILDTSQFSGELGNGITPRFAIDEGLDIHSLRCQVSSLWKALEVKDFEIANLSEENQNCRQLAIESTLKVAQLCHEYETNKLSLSNKCRNLQQSIRTARSLTINWRNSNLTNAHSFCATLLEVIGTE